MGRREELLKGKGTEQGKRTCRKKGCNEIKRAPQRNPETSSWSYLGKTQGARKMEKGQKVERLMGKKEIRFWQFRPWQQTVDEIGSLHQRLQAKSEPGNRL